VTQPFSDRRHTRSDNDGADDDKDAHDRDEPHRLYPDCPCRDHDGQDYGANKEPVDVHLQVNRRRNITAQFAT
jgi:hypothetical protein